MEIPILAIRRPSSRPFLYKILCKSFILCYMTSVTKVLPSVTKELEDKWTAAGGGESQPGSQR